MSRKIFSEKFSFITSRRISSSYGEMIKQSSSWYDTWLTHSYLDIFFKNSSTCCHFSPTPPKHCVGATHAHTHTLPHQIWCSMACGGARESVTERERAWIKTAASYTFALRTEDGEREWERERDEDGREGELERGKRGLAVPAWLHWSPSSLILSLSLSQTHTLSPGQLNQTCDRNLLIWWGHVLPLQPSRKGKGRLTRSKSHLRFNRDLL